ncbi:MAG: efflux RND transporter periplasmic adaptor subunit [Bacteroidetes bacterium]|nr:efflux RND transporter periplasmic adaptor subunit [Bacteroidota bacterium]
MKRRVWMILGLVAVAALGIWWFAVKAPAEDSGGVLVSPKRGEFMITVTTTGELSAKNSKDIRGPQGVGQIGIWQMKISNLVAEGTQVKTGDFVAEIDQTDVASKMKDGELAIQKAQAEYNSARLDTALTLSQAREDIVTLEFAEQQSKLLKEQSVYEAPAVRKQVDLDFEKTERQLKQSKTNYQTKVAQAVAKMQTVGADLAREQQKLQRMTEVMQQFRITAPAPGIVVYYREWNGKKRTVGSQINEWSPTVATIPDLDTMESVTYVNEVDIQKIKVGMQVRLGLDSDPSKKYTGEVTSVANIGEQRPNSDSKVFEVRILIREKDTTLRPSMTTSNTIYVSTLPNKLYVPLECLHPEGSQTFVYKKDGGQIVKQQVQVGETNENEATIVQGLSEKDRVFLSVPSEERRRSATVRTLPKIDSAKTTQPS